MGAALATATATAADTEPPAALPRAPQAPAAVPASGGKLIRATPLPQYWNAQSWDPAGGSLFWHDPSEKRRQAMSERHARRPVPVPAPPVRPPAAGPPPGR